MSLDDAVALGRPLRSVLSFDLLKKAAFAITAILALWIVALVFLGLCANDLFHYAILRSRIFAASTNLILAGASIAVIVQTRLYWKQRPLILAIPLSLYLLALLALWPVLLGSFVAPPWKEQSPPIPMSAATNFMQDVWAWENRK